MKKSIFLTIVSLGLFFLGCEKNFDDKVNKENAVLDFTSKRVTIETIPDIMSFIERNMKSQVYKFKTSGKKSLDSPRYRTNPFVWPQQI